jgi:aminopeptidase
VRTDFNELMDKYADLILKVGLNLQPGQRLSIGSHHDVYRTPLEAAPLVRILATKAYQMGASLVDVFWGDDQVDLARAVRAKQDYLTTYPSWIAGEMIAAAGRGDARLSITGGNPYLYSDVDPDRLGMIQRARAAALDEAYLFNDQHPFNWCAAKFATSSWATAVFPDLTTSDAINALWEQLIQFCYLEAEDPISVWNDHNRDLYLRGEWLTQSAFKSLHFRSHQTDLWLDLPPNHIWVGGIDKLPDGLEYCANLPTEEICTLPDLNGVRGYVQATKPVSYRGMYFEGIRLEFEDGQVTQATADKGQDQLRQLLETDEGASRLGEVALVPHSSPISQSGIIFHSILLDENASCHIALGNGYRFNLAESESMDKETFAAAGGNTSSIHFDFMIGSDLLDVDGIDAEGNPYPLLRAGEWAFKSE